MCTQFFFHGRNQRTQRSGSWFELTAKAPCALDDLGSFLGSRIGHIVPGVRLMRVDVLEVDCSALSRHAVNGSGYLGDEHVAFAGKLVSNPW